MQFFTIASALVVAVPFTLALPTTEAKRTALDVTSGKATWYNTTNGVQASSCGDYAHDTDFVAAVSSSIIGGNCYKTATVQNDNTGAQIIVTIVDTCVACSNPANGVAIDLTPTAFGQLADLGAGTLPATWWFN